MIELLLFLSLIQLGSSCMCGSPDDPKLFCDNPEWNAVQIKITEVTKPVLSRWSIYEDIVNGIDMEKRELPTGWVTRTPGIWGAVEDVWMNEEKEALAVVEKVWGLGAAKVGQEIKVSSWNYESMCGVAEELYKGVTAVIWIKQDTDKVSMSLCDMYRFQWLGDSTPEKYVDDLNAKTC